ncbi:MAG: gfo/Idh/MocA family oxidoreductase [Bacteroidetes bacterium]|nr:MAG: gfo/Idh/MocA family oxidoreductase [Bacteroidota bacterium]
MKKPLQFGLIGAAGYIAPRHMKAIKETGNNLLAALDPFDSVGIIDGYFPDADFFTEPERFDRHMDKLRRKGKESIDYVSICSPNYLHDSHIRMTLRNQAHAICEKPLVLNPWNLDGLAEIEKETGKKIYNILQLRHHHAVVSLKERIEQGPEDKIYDIDLTYITSRGAWYFYSWKGNNEKSGGVATNIGVHFFDMLTWIFGNVKENIVNVSQRDKAAGYLHLERARVRWFLSVDRNDLPADIMSKGQFTYRSIKLDGEEFEFSGGFTDLHTITYQNILDGKGFELQAARPSITIVHDIRNKTPIGLKGEYHPMAT